MEGRLPRFKLIPTCRDNQLWTTLLICNKVDNEDVDGDDDDDDGHLCLEDGPALRHEWEGFEQHIGPTSPHRGQLGNENVEWMEILRLLRSAPDKCQFGNGDWEIHFSGIFYQGEAKHVDESESDTASRNSASSLKLWNQLIF